MTIEVKPGFAKALEKTILVKKSFISVDTYLEEFQKPKRTILASIDSFRNELLRSVEELEANKTKEKTSTRGRKKREEPAERPDVIMEENEDGDEVLSSDNYVPPIKIKVEDETQSITNMSTTGRPKRNATEVAYERFKYQNEMANKTKLRRPSDFNQNDYVAYNVYNQVDCSTTTSEFVQKNKRRKGSTNTTVTSSHFFSDLVHSSSPIQKIGTCVEGANKSLEISMIPPVNQPSETFTMDNVNGTTKNTNNKNKSRNIKNSTAIVHDDIDENSELTTTRTRTRRGKRQADETTLSNKSKEVSNTTTKNQLVENKNESEQKSSSEIKEKENHGDEISSQNDLGNNNTDATEEDNSEINNTRTKKKGKRKTKKQEEKCLPENSESDGEGPRTRTKTNKKPFHKIENLPVISSVPNSPSGKNISEKIKEKLQVFENNNSQDKNSSADTSEGRVTRTKTRNVNKTDEDKNKVVAAADPFKVPLAVKPSKDMKKGGIPRKIVEKPKEPTVIDTKLMSLDEKKRLREERAQKAAAAREQAEREKREHALRLEKEKEEKMKLKKLRDEKLKEELERRRIQAAQKKQAEIEAQKRELEEARLAKLNEIMEQEERKAAQRKKEAEVQERKIQQAKLAEKLKPTQTKVISKPTVEPIFVISEEAIPSDDEDESHPKQPIPSWAQRDNRNVHLANQIYLAEYLPTFFENPDDFYPSLTELFGHENVRLRQRTSSAVWNATLNESIFNKK